MLTAFYELECFLPDGQCVGHKQQAVVVPWKPPEFDW